MKHSWVMYVFLAIIAGIMLRNAAGTIGIMLATGTTGTGIIGALEGPSVAQKGTFSFGGNQVKIG